MIITENVVYWSVCVCGAATVELDDGNSYCCQVEDLPKFFPDVNFENLEDRKNSNSYVACDYCVNHYGLDLCSCGSGEKVNECECGSRKPMQVVGEYDKVCANDAISVINQSGSCECDKDIARNESTDAISDKQISDMADLAKRYKQLQKEFMQSVEESIKNTPQLDGVHNISSAPQCFTVSLSTILDHKTNLSAEYYSQSAQGDAVIKKLQHCNGDFDKISAALKNMLEKKKVEFNSDSDKTVYLNPNTLATIQKIYAGFQAISA